MNITKEEIKSAGLQHVENVKGSNACYDSFVAGVEYMLQRLEQCNVSGALPHGVKLCDCPECGAEIQYGLAADVVDKINSSKLLGSNDR